MMQTKHKTESNSTKALDTAIDVISVVSQTPQQ